MVVQWPLKVAVIPNIEITVEIKALDQFLWSYNEMGNLCGASNDDESVERVPFNDEITNEENDKEKNMKVSSSESTKNSRSDTYRQTQSPALQVQRRKM